MAGARAGARVALIYATVETAFLVVVPWLGANALGDVLAWVGPRRAMAGISPSFTLAAFVVYVMAGAALSGAVAAVLAAIIGPRRLAPAESPAFWASLASLEIVLIFGVHAAAYGHAAARVAVVIAAGLATTGLVRARRCTGEATCAEATDSWVVMVVLVGVSFLSDGTRTPRLSHGLLVALFVAAIAAARLLVARVGRVALGRGLLPRSRLPALSRATWLVVLGTLGAIVCAREWRPSYVPAAPIRQQGRGGPNVVLITLDSVRWDHVSLSGYFRRTTPNLERMAAEASVYTNAIASSNTTLPTHASIFTGLNPGRHGGHPDAATGLGLPISPRVATLAELLSTRGYRTVAIVANTSFLGPEFGFDRGFSHYDLHWMVQPFSRTAPYLLRQGLRNAAVRVLRPPRAEDVFAGAATINEAAIGYLGGAAKTGEPFFLFLNYMDAHAPYLPPPPFDARYPGRDPTFRWDQYGRLISEVQGHLRPITERERSNLESQYDGGIAYLDHQLASLFGTLRALHLYDDSLIIITSDHGEGFGEQSIIGHGTSLYQHQLHVPLIVKYPGARAPRVVTTLVSSVDLLPTILDVVGAPIPALLDGDSLRAVDRAQGRWVSAESFGADVVGNFRSDGRATEVALFHGNLKLVRNAATGSSQVFDLSADRAEAANLVDRLSMGAEWNDRLAALGGNGERSKVVPAIDAETRERLRALGYIK